MDRRGLVERAVVCVATIMAQSASIARRTLARTGRTAEAEIAALREDCARKNDEIAILRARLARIPPQNRPQYDLATRWRILWHVHRYALSVREACRRFLVSRRTLQRWLDGVKRASGSAACRLPELVREVVHRIKVAQPSWGTKRIATWLARIGLQCARSSVQRILRERPIRTGPRAVAVATRKRGKKGPLRAKRPNHMWQMDHSEIRLLGFLFCRVSAVIDLFSRKVLAIEIWREVPTGRSMARLVERAMDRLGIAPKHLVTDQGTQFHSRQFGSCLKRHGIAHRFGGIRSPASIAVLERFWRSFKSERTGVLWPFLGERELQRRAHRYADWFNAHRPHQGLHGATPDDVYFGRSTKQRPRSHGILRLRHLDGDPGLPIYSVARRA